MVSATNSPPPEHLLSRSVAALDAQLRELDVGAIPLLVFRLPALERTAWRDGLRAARALERRAGAAFSTAVARVLRGDDRIAHDRGSDAFVAALVAPTRDGHRSLAPVDVRRALARIATTVEGLTRLDVDAGWIRYDARGAADIAEAVVRALIAGAQERERYAFFSAVGHELRTPLASIRGYLETLLADEVDEPTRRRFVGIAYNEALRLGRLLEGMFEISLLDLAATFPQQTVGMLDVVLAGAADACAAAAQQRGIVLDVAAAAPAPVAIDGDRLMLVLINLIDNAIKRGRPGGRVEVRLDPGEPRAVVVWVDDDGPGIPPEQRERVFELGARGPTSAAGSGIGLALVRMLLERAGGRVEVGESPLGGARFTVTVPRHEEL